MPQTMQIEHKFLHITGRRVKDMPKYNKLGGYTQKIDALTSHNSDQSWRKQARNSKFNSLKEDTRKGKENSKVFLKTYFQS